MIGMRETRLSRTRYASTDSTPLDELVQGVRERSRAAFASLHEQMADPLFAFARNLLRERQAAEDAVQQTFLELVQSADKIKGDGRSLRAWLYRSVRYNCLDEIRRRERRPETPVATLPDTPAPADVTHVLDPDLEAAMGLLTEQQRTVMFLRHVVGLSGAETAHVTRVSRAAVFATARRAEGRLREALTNEGGGS